METVDFSSASPTNPLILSFQFGPGVDRSGVGTIVLYHAGSETSSGLERRLNVDAFYVAPPELAIVSAGGACPIAGSEFLPPDEIFPLTLFVVEGKDDQIVYACTGNTIVGVVEISYIADTADAPSSSPTIDTLVSLYDS